MMNVIEIQQWGDGAAVVFAEGTHDAGAFMNAVRAELGRDEVDEYGWTEEDVAYGDFFKLTTPPDGFYSYYESGAGAGAGVLGAWVRGTYIAS